MKKQHDTNSSKANLIYDTLMKHYPAEIKQIQMLQAQDMATKGYVSEATERRLNELMDRVVADNQRLGRTWNLITNFCTGLLKKWAEIRNTPQKR